MCSAEELEFPQKLLEHQYGFAVSKTIFTACELGVFDLLHEVQEPLSAANIASCLSTSEDGMERLLDACVGLKLLKVDLKNNEEKDNVSMKGLSEDLQKTFLKQFTGCTGALAKQLVSTYKQSTITIMDLPNVVQAAKKHFVTDKEQQIHFLEGDFFNDPIPEADLFILARIIHDWTEDKCLKLLKKIYQSCKPGGGVLLVEVLLNEDKSGPLMSQLFSLSMLVQTEGKERTSSKYTKFLTESGFRNIEVKVTGKIYDAILGRK